MQHALHGKGHRDHVFAEVEDLVGPALRRDAVDQLRQQVREPARHLIDVHPARRGHLFDPTAPEDLHQLFRRDGHVLPGTDPRISLRAEASLLELLKQFQQMQKMMKQVRRMGWLKGLGGGLNLPQA